MVELRNQGMPYTNIGKVFGISRARAHQIISGYGDLLHSNNSNGWYAIIVQEVKDRDGQKCQKCGSNECLVIHHIDRDDRNNRQTNLVTLCSSCHGIIHAQPRHEECHTKFICQICGKEFEIKRSQVKRQQKRIDAGAKVHLPRFCSKKCYGSWFGKTYGWGKQSPLIT